jgi:hypothetical protein
MYNAVPTPASTLPNKKLRFSDEANRSAAGGADADDGAADDGQANENAVMEEFIVGAMDITDMDGAGGAAGADSSAQGDTDVDSETAADVVDNADDLDTGVEQGLAAANDDDAAHGGAEAASGYVHTEASGAVEPAAADPRAGSTCEHATASTAAATTSTGGASSKPASAEAENLKVFLRVRPMNSEERKAGGERVIAVENESTIRMIAPEVGAVPRCGAAATVELWG